MSQPEPLHADWRCHVGRHHYVTAQDDNPEMRGHIYLECTRCGKQDPDYGPTSAKAMGWGILK